MMQGRPSIGSPKPGHLRLPGGDAKGRLRAWPMGARRVDPARAPTSHGPISLQRAHPRQQLLPAAARDPSGHTADVGAGPVGGSGRGRIGRARAEERAGGCCVNDVEASREDPVRRDVGRRLQHVRRRSQAGQQPASVRVSTVSGRGMRRYEAV